MNEKELLALKKQYFASNQEKHPYIPLECYTLPEEAIEQYEQLKIQAKIAQAEQRKKIVESKRIATRGEVSLQRRVRRSVGDYSIDGDDARV
jgi:transcriptional regulator of aromatic amino acid metabolism